MSPFFKKRSQELNVPSKPDTFSTIPSKGQPHLPNIWALQSQMTFLGVTNAAYETIDALRRTANRGTTLERSVKKTTKVLKVVLPARNLTLNSDGFPNYKHMFSPHRDPLLHLWNITMQHIYQKHCDETKQRGQWRPETSKPQTGPRWTRPQILADRHQPSETD